jgi:hypothetical protein
MRVLLRSLLLLALAVPVAAGVAAWLAVEAQPAVPLAAAPSVADIARATQLLQQHDPRRALPGITRAAVVTAHELELLLAQGARRVGAEPRAQVALRLGEASVRLSLPLPATPLGRWLNLRAELRQTTGLPVVDHLQLGRLPVPGWLAEWALPGLVRLAGLQAQAALAQQIVSRIGFFNRQMVVAFAWPDDLQQRLVNTLMSPDDQARLQAHAERLATLTAELRRELGARTPVPLPRLLQPMMAFAQQRSAGGGRSAVRENRAALLALACLVNGASLSALVPQARHWPKPRMLTVTLAGRVDTPQHYLVSAALAIEGGGPLADAIGLSKEVADAHGGSGFSFNDLAADRAGTRFGLLAARAPAVLQARLAGALSEADLLPPVADLPEDMQDPQFVQRFGGIGAPAYRALMADIEARLDRLPLLAAAPG